MLGKVLRVDAHPYAYVALTGVRAAAGTFRVEPAVTLNGVTRTVPADVTVETTPDGMRVTGRMTILQTDFGLVPYSLLAGALEVQDALAMRFDLRAVAVSPAAPR
jgi:polyisoprenoid-binding protein YceI